MTKLILGDCIEKMQELPENSIDAIVTDPPYGISFMEKKWDRFRTNKEFQLFSERWGKEALRVLKPGGYAFIFGGERLYHRLFCGVEDAGFKLKTCFQWLYVSGFPKSQDIAKMFDKYHGHEIKLNKNKLQVDVDGKIKKESREIGRNKFTEVYNTSKSDGSFLTNESVWYAYEPTSEDAKKWNGYKTAIKPAYEPIGLFQKPKEGTYIENILKWDVGALNIDACRIPINVDIEPDNRIRETDKNIKRTTKDGTSMFWGEDKEYLNQLYELKGRYPSNIIIDEMVAEIMDAISGEMKSPKGKCSATKTENNSWKERKGLCTPGRTNIWNGKGDVGGLSKYFQKVKFNNQTKRRIEEYNDGIFNRDNCGFFDNQLKEGIANYNDGDGLSKYFHKVPFRYVPKASSGERHLGLKDVQSKVRDTSRNKPVDNAYNRNNPVKNSHPSVKPIKLLCYLIRMIKPPVRKPIILDPFLGSGSTAIACKIELCDCIGIEMNPEYMEIAKKRIAVPLEQFQKYTDSQIYSDDENQKKLTSFSDWL